MCVDEIQVVEKQDSYGDLGSASAAFWLGR